MPTFNQLCKNSRTSKIKLITVPALEKCPQKRGTCTKATTLTPKKPCSARRAICQAKIIKTWKLIYCHIPGIGHTLRRYSTVLIRGGRTNDLPGIKYKLIRNV